MLHFFAVLVSIFPCLWLMWGQSKTSYITKIHNTHNRWINSISRLSFTHWLENIDVFRVDWIREWIWFHFSSADTNPMLDKHQPEDAIGIQPSGSCRCCRYLGHMALLVEMCIYSDKAVNRLFPLGKCSHQFCRVQGTCTWLWVDHWALCHSLMVWWHGNPTHG